MSAPSERRVEVAGGACRIWEKGEGEPLAVLPGLGGCPRWTPFLDALAQDRRVVVVSLPGFPGSDDHHRLLDGHLDWVAATLDLLEAAELAGADLVSASVGGMLAAEVAALAPGFVRKLVLTSSFGLYDEAMQGENVFAALPGEALAIQTEQQDRYHEVFDPPEDPEESAEWQLRQYRASEAAARIVWPFGERGLAKRLHRIRIPVLLLWGEKDRIVPAGYAKLFAQGLAGSVETKILPGAGHQLWIDEPESAAAAIRSFLS
jgi:pimeloyl-ACP methyl ester carboxylesterase